MNSLDRRKLEDAARRWGVTLEGEAMRTDYSMIQHGRRAGAPVTLKRLDLSADEATCGAALRHYAGAGAVEPLAEEDGVLLMRRVIPGTDLSSAKDEDAVMAFCHVASRLHALGPPSGGFPTVEDWGRGFERHRQSDRPGIPAALLDEAEAVFHDLAASQGPRVLLHGDLHHYNIMNDAKLGWLAIDAKGVIGEPAYEAGAFLRNPDDLAICGDARILVRRLDQLADQLGYERDRMLRWHFAQGVLTTIWFIEDGGDPAKDLAITRTARTLL